MKVIYPGSFDPATYGHLDIINRAAKTFDNLVVGILNNKSKNNLFTLDERVEMLEHLLYDYNNIEIKVFDGLLVDFFKKENANAIIRGLRAVSDYEYELQMAQVNKELHKEVETLFMVANTEYSYISSSIVKEVAQFGGDISSFVPEYVEEKIYEKLGGKYGYNSTNR